MPRKDEEIILAPGPEVEIGGRKFTLRRLNTRDVFTFARILADAARRAGPEATLGIDPAVGFALVAALASDQLAEWLAGLIGLTLDEFYALPQDAAEKLLGALEGHQDLQAFFAAAVRLMEKLMSVWQRSST